MKSLSTSEVIKLFHEIKVPADLRFAKDRVKEFHDLDSAINHLNDYNENRTEETYLAVEHLINAMQHLLTHSANQFIKFQRIIVNKQLEVRKKDAEIDALKSFNEFSKELDKKTSSPKKNNDDDAVAKEYKRLMKSV